MDLDEYDIKMLMHAMKCYRRDLEKKARRNERVGWEPEPGKGDLVAAQMRRWEALWERLRTGDRDRTGVSCLEGRHSGR